LLKSKPQNLNSKPPYLQDEPSWHLTLPPLDKRTEITKNGDKDIGKAQDLSYDNSIME